jgi:hypothetical protein
MDEEKPITDKENFPPKTDEHSLLEFQTIRIAYCDGWGVGYRVAVRDFLLWFLAFLLIGLILRTKIDI